jgi:hypothetical protein
MPVLPFTPLEDRMHTLSHPSLFAALLLASATLPFATAAYSQTTGIGGPVETRISNAVKKIQDACATDVKSFCGNVTPGEGRLVLCMMAHDDKVSTKCEYSLYEASRNLERAVDRVEQTADACWDDIEKHCGEVQDGQGRVAQCLAAKKASFSNSCQTVLNKLPKK